LDRLISKYSYKWKKIIFERDKYKCRICGSNYKLNLAHITDKKILINKLGGRTGIPFSYRYDNLVTLCKDCHNAYHRSKRGFNVHISQIWRVREVNKLFYRLEDKRKPLVVNGVDVW